AQVQGLVLMRLDAEVGIAAGHGCAGRGGSYTAEGGSASVISTSTSAPTSMPAACRSTVLIETPSPSPTLPTLARWVCPFRVTVTAGVLPPPSASLTSGGPGERRQYVRRSGLRYGISCPSECATTGSRSPDGSRWQPQPAGAALLAPAGLSS